VLSIDVNRSNKSNDRLTCQAKLTAGGTLQVTLTAGSYQAGDVLTIFSAKTYSGSFAAIEPQSPAEGLAWDTSTLMTDGKLRIKTAEATAIGSITTDCTVTPVYNLNGQRLTHTRKGINIIGGKVFIQ